MLPNARSIMIIARARAWALFTYTMEADCGIVVCAEWLCVVIHFDTRKSESEILTSVAVLAASIQDWYRERDDIDTAAARADLMRAPEQIVATLRSPVGAFTPME